MRKKSTPPFPFRPSPAEKADMDFFTKEHNLYNTPSGAVHAALAIGFREMKIERGFIQAPIDKKTEDKT